MHAVVVRDRATVPAIQEWHREEQPGALVLLPLDPGPQLSADHLPMDARLRAEGPAEAWVRAALAGSEILDESGRVLRRASGAISLSGQGAPTGPLRRRAELASLVQDVEQSELALAAADAALAASQERLTGAEELLVAAQAAADAARAAERQAAA